MVDRVEADRVRPSGRRHPRAQRVSWTDWAGVRRELGSDVDMRSSAAELQAAFLADRSLVLLDLEPVVGEYVLSDLSSGAVLFATC